MKTLRCPVCKSELKITGQARLETLSEHVCDPNGEISFKNKYECLSESCVCNGLVMWNEYGELYVKGDYKKFHESILDKINNAPYGSFERCSNVEIYKKGLPKRTKGIKIGRFEIFFEYCYQSNEEGEVLKTKKKLQLLKYDKDSVYAHYIFLPRPLCMLARFLVRKKIISPDMGVKLTRI